MGLSVGLPGLDLADALEGAQVDQDVDERVQVGDGRAVAQPGALDTGFGCLRVDPLDGRALLGAEGPRA